MKYIALKFIKGKHLYYCVVSYKIEISTVCSKIAKAGASL